MSHVNSYKETKRENACENVDKRVISILGFLSMIVFHYCIRVIMKMKLIDFVSLFYAEMDRISSVEAVYEISATDLILLD